MAQGGLLLDRGPAGSLTEHNVALTCILRQDDLFSRGEVLRLGGRFVGTYHAYPGAGYEVGPAAIGLCFSRDLRRWEVGPPCLRAEEGGPWERGGLYKSWLLEHEGTFYLFYNAKDRAEWPWIESTGVATSPDLEEWRRYEGNPVLPAGSPGEFDDRFASDPVVLRCGRAWAMFYYGLCSDGHARDLVAFSWDLLRWEKGGAPLVDVGPPGSIDSLYAHKPGLISRDGRLHHFYTAVAPAPPRRIGSPDVREMRGISLACRGAPTPR